MQKTDLLIRTKLHLPFIRPGLVSRPRLHALINQGLRGPLTLITAPAGFGKTTLVAACVASCGMPVAWLSLDKEDNQSGRFLRYLVAALQKANQSIGSEVAELMAAAPQVPPEVVLTGLINDLDSANTDIVLVLDDYQLISSQAVHDQVVFLLDHQPDTLHLVIATRADPPLPLSRLRARGQTVELRAADLRFTEPEAVAFLNDIMHLQLEAGAVAVLEDRTEGWIAGLQMASIALQSHLATRGRADVDRFIQAFAGTHRFIMDFMLEEVLAREPEEVQSFLLQTAVLNRLSGPLCDAVTGSTGGQAMLDQLERRNLFIVLLDDESAGGMRWYRYHHLFADLLQAKLHQSGANRAAQLLSRAAAWCEQAGQITEAVSYALAARDYERAARLVAAYWEPITNNGEIETIWSWLNELPEDTVKASAPLSIAYCRVLWLTGQVGAIEAHLVNAEQALDRLDALNQADKDRVTASAAFAHLPAEVAALRSFIAHYHSQFEAARVYAERAMRLIPDNLPAQASAQMHSVFLMALATAYDGAGDLEQTVSSYNEIIHWARQCANLVGVAGTTYILGGALRMLGRLRMADTACRDAHAYIQAQGFARLPAVGILHLAISELLLERNDLDAAQSHLAQGMALGKWSGGLDAVRNAAYVRSRLSLAQQDASGALTAIQEAEASLGEQKHPLAQAELLALKARVLLWQGAVAESANCIEEAIHLVGQNRGKIYGVIALVRCRVQLAQCRPDEGVALLTQALAEAEACGRFGTALELRILRSLALVQEGDSQAAQTDLEQALAQAEPEGFVRIFIDEGQPMQHLLTHWLAHAKASRLRGYAAHLLTHFNAGHSLEISEPENISKPSHQAETEVRVANDLLLEPLSQRELEVLRLMVLGKTNQEIARQLIVAPGTIKAHAASIYRKLDVANRTEAVARARQLGILP